MIKFILTILLLISILPTHSQESRISKTYDEGLEYLIPLREEIWKNIIKEDSVNQITINQKVYILARNDKDIDTSEFLYPREQIICDYWLGNYSNLLKEIPDGRHFHNEKAQNKLFKEDKYKLLTYYGKDSIMWEMLTKTYQRSYILNKKINESNLSASDKDFLKIYFESIIAYNRLNKTNKDTIYAHANNYLERYPESSYKNNINEWIAPHFKLSKFGYGGGFNAGYMGFNGDLGKIFSGGVSIGASVDISYSRVMLLMNFAGMTVKTKASFILDDENWGRDFLVSNTVAHFCLGYNIINNHTNRLTPFIGIANTSFSTDKNQNNTAVGLDDNTDDEKAVIYSFGSQATPTAGIVYDYKFHFFKGASEYDDLFKDNENKSFGYFRFKAGYNDPLFYKLSSSLGGNALYFSIGIGTFIRPSIKIKSI